MINLVFDITLMKPGCVLLQAAFGCNPAHASAFSSEDWIVAPTPDMKTYSMTEEQFAKLVRKVEEVHHGTREK